MKPSALPALLLFAATTAAHAQVSQLRGMVTDTAGIPIPGVVVQLRSPESPMSLQALTNEQGVFVLARPTSHGPYLLSAHRLPFRALSIVIDPDTNVIWRLQLRHRPISLSPSVTRERAVLPLGRPRQDAAGFGSGITALTALSYAAASGDIAAMAEHLNPGVQLTYDDQGVANGISLNGQPASATGVVFDGATSTSLSIPSEAMSAVHTYTSTYDVSRGQFTSGQIAVTSRTGSEKWQGVVAPRITSPVLPVPETVSGRGAEQTGSLNIGFGGPIVPGWLYLYTAAEFSNAGRRNPAVQFAGGPPFVNTDTLAQLAQVASGLGLSSIMDLKGPRSSTRKTNWLLRLDSPFALNQTATVRLDASDRESSIFAPSSLTGTSGARHSSDHGVLFGLASAGDRISNEARIYAHNSLARSEPAYAMPQAIIRVAWEQGNQLNNRNFTIGSPSSIYAASRAHEIEIGDEFAWMRPGFLKLVAGFTARRESAARVPGNNPFGTFLFLSPDDFSSGKAAAFSKQVAPALELVATSDYIAGYLGIVRRVLGTTVSPGVRGEWQHFSGKSVSSPSPDHRLALLPLEASVLPRIGFYAEPRSWLAIRGGSGAFRSPNSAATVALAQTETRASESRLICIDTEAPSPRWSEFLGPNNPSSPDCRDKTSGETAQISELSFSKHFHAPGLWRSSLGTLMSVGGNASISVDASYSVSTSQALLYDANLRSLPRFRVEGEQNRPVYVNASAIDSRSAVFALQTSRVSDSLAHDLIVSSNGRSQVFQLETHLGGILPLTQRRGFGSISYAYTASQQDATAVPWSGSIAGSTAGDPNGAVSIGNANTPRHAFSISANWLAFPVRRILIGFSANIRSGVRYTPVVASDINGDGFANDRAFVFDPAAISDTSFRTALIEQANNSPARACLRRQKGKIAGESSCESPWSWRTTASLNWTPAGAREVSLSLDALNVVGLLARAIGRDAAMLGEPSSPDGNLLFVRGFDPLTRSFRYDANPRFGFPRAAGAGMPASVQVRLRWSFGGDPALTRTVARAVNPIVGDSMTRMKAALREAIVNTPAKVVALNGSNGFLLQTQELIALTLVADSLQSRIDASVNALAAVLSETTTNLGESARVRRVALIREAEGLIANGLSSARGVLGLDRWNRLPSNVRQPSLSIPLGIPMTTQRADERPPFP